MPIAKELWVGLYAARHRKKMVNKRLHTNRREMGKNLERPPESLNRSWETS